MLSIANSMWRSLLGARVGTEDAQTLGDVGQAGQRAARGRRVAITDEIQVERVFPRSANDGARLDLGEVDLALRERLEGMEERAWFVGRAEDDAGFERLRSVLEPDESSPVRPRHDEEAREILRVALDTRGEDVRAVERGGGAAGDGRLVPAAILDDHLDRAGGVVRGQDLEGGRVRSQP